MDTQEWTVDYEELLPDYGVIAEFLQQVFCCCRFTRPTN
jgi:hypothetical protein